MYVTKYYFSKKIDDKNYLLINTITSALDVVEENVINYLEDLKSDSSKGVEISEDIRNALISRGYIFNNINEDTLLLDKKLNHIISNNSEGEFIICPTYLCNLRCSYCFEDLKVRCNGNILTKEEVDKIFEAIKHIASEKGFKKCRITLYGGEPFQLITKEIVSYIFELSRKENYALSAITNGTNLNEFLPLLNEYKSLFRFIQITLDGPKDIHDKFRVRADGSGSFDDIVSNINSVLATGINLGLRVNTGRNNVSYIPELLTLIKDYNWNKMSNFHCQLAPINDHYCTGTTSNWIPESDLLLKIYNLFDNFDDVRDEYKLKLGTDIEKRTALIRSIWKDSEYRNSFISISPCSASSRTSYVFGADKYIYACPESVGNVEYSIGKFFPEFYIDEKQESIWKRNVSNIEKCKECNIAGLCGTPCTWSSIATNGKEFKTPVCTYAQETIDNFIDLNKNKILQILR